LKQRDQAERNETRGAEHRKTERSAAHVLSTVHLVARAGRHVRSGD
jgi:hypothetical protein